MALTLNDLTVSISHLDRHALLGDWLWLTGANKVPVLVTALGNAFLIDKDTGAIFVDRFMSTAMHYPCNYGYIPQTLSLDGDPCDVLVLSPMPLVTGVVVRCRPIGMLKLDDEAGGDSKILAVPIDKLSSLYRNVKSPRDLPEIEIRQIQHFFEHYKDLEPGKWVRVGSWVEAEDARREIVESVARYRA